MVETGWEAMVINRALAEGRYDSTTILRDYTVSRLLAKVAMMWHRDQQP